MDQVSRPQGMRLWLRLLLFASLALNLAVVGVVAGALLSGGPSRDAARSLRDPVVPYTRALDETQRKQIRRDLRRAFDRGRDGGLRPPGAGGDYAVVLELLRTDPFDRAAFDAVLVRQGDGARARMELGQKVLGDFLEGLSAADRDAYAARLEDEVARLARRRPPQRRD